MTIKHICCIGAGYVGGPTMAVIALKCPSITVTVVDKNQDKINAWNGPLEHLPVYEPGLPEVVREARGRNLFFSTNIDGAIEAAEMIFMAVNTPTKTEGEGAGMAADLRYVEACAKQIGRVAKTDKIVVEKSTLPVRTAERIKEILVGNSQGINFEILSNPEFLAEGTAIQDLFKSDRVLIGGDETASGKEAIHALVGIYAQWIPKEKILTTNVWSSELSKLASNAMLAQRISSINSLSALCEKTGANIQELSKAIGMDQRIGPHFLRASVGFGGSCFQKDILNLVYLSKYYGLDEVAEYWHQVVKINDYQKNRFAQKIIDSISESNKKKCVTILGWSFKANTDDSRESASIDVSKYLLKAGFTLKIYDPMVIEERIIDDLNKKFNSQIFFKSYRDKIFISDNLKDSLSSSSAIILLTEWDEFIHLKKYLSDNQIIFDGRLILNNLKGNKLYQIGVGSD